MNLERWAGRTAKNGIRALHVDVQASDDADIADNMENYESNISMLRDLQKSHDDTVRASVKSKKVSTASVKFRMSR